MQLFRHAHILFCLEVQELLYLLLERSRHGLNLLNLLAKVVFLALNLLLPDLVAHGKLSEQLVFNWLERWHELICLSEEASIDVLWTVHVLFDGKANLIHDVHHLIGFALKLASESLSTVSLLLGHRLEVLARDKLHPGLQTEKVSLDALL